MAEWKDPAVQRYAQSEKGKAARARAQKRYEASHPEETRARQRVRAARYHQSERGRLAAARSAAAKSEAQKHAYGVVRAALDSGRLTAEPCVVCGSAKTQAHHPNGYDPRHVLDVMWLCSLHHKRLHRGLVDGHTGLPDTAYR